MKNVTLFLSLVLLSGCGAEDERPIHQAALFYDADEQALFCPAADEQRVMEAEDTAGNYEPIAAWCSWKCARYEPAYPEPGSVVLLLERGTLRINVFYAEHCQ